MSILCSLIQFFDYVSVDNSMSDDFSYISIIIYAPRQKLGRNMADMYGDRSSEYLSANSVNGLIRDGAESFSFSINS